MNRIQAISLAIALVAGGNAMADDITIDPNPFVSTASRAQMQEELHQLRQAGVNPWADDHNPLDGFRSSLTREQVTADFMASRTAAAALSSEDSGSTYLARMQAPATERAIVIARRR